MLLDLLRSLFNKLGLIVLVAFFLSRSGFIKGYLLKEKMSRIDKVVFSFVFGALGIIGTYSGVPVNGAIANSRSIGVIIGGLFGGPSVGIAAGLIAGIHRMLLPTGRFTAIACGLSTIIGGVIAGYAKPIIFRQKNKWLYGALLTIIIEAVQMSMILLIAKPFSDALNLVQIIFIPMAFINAFGTGVFILLIEQIHEENEYNAAVKAGLALKIASKTLPILRKGLNTRSAKKACEIIFENSDMNAVSITNKTRILAHIGASSSHHIEGELIHTKTTKQALMTGTYVVANNKSDIECSDSKCKLQSAVIVPLYMREHIIGTLKLYKTNENRISLSDIEMAKGLAYLFSTQLELSQLTYQEELLAKSELKALQAQIQPHFLFNALNTIISFCRTDALKARELLTKLSIYLRTSFKTNTSFITLDQEVEHIKNYLDIEEARFSDRLEVTYDIDSTIHCDVPPLILQPIVENALKHGLADKAKGASLLVKVSKNKKYVCITIQDNGSGMSNQRLQAIKDSQDSVTGIGIINVMTRIKSIYNTDLIIKSSPNKGTTVIIYIPLDKLTQTKEQT